MHITWRTESTLAYLSRVIGAMYAVQYGAVECGTGECSGARAAHNDGNYYNGI